MIRLRKYLKPYLLPLLLAIICLFGQAYSELTLPNMMSDIVNTGIQQGGFESATPTALSEDAFTVATFVMTDSEKTTVESAYTLMPAGTGDTALYPAAATTAIYVKKEGLSESEEAQLATAFGHSSYTLSLFSQAAGSTTSSKTTTNTTSEDADIDFAQLVPLLSQIPASSLAPYQEKAAAVQDSILTQSGVAMAKIYAKSLGVDVAKIQSNYILKIGGNMLLLTVFGAAAAIAVGFFSSRTAAGVSRDLRKGVFSKVESFSLAEFDRFSTASLITRTTNDITQIQMLIVMGIRMMIYSPIMAIGGIIKVSQTDSSMTWIIALVVAVLIALFVVVFLLTSPKFKLQQKLTDRVNLVSREELTGQMVIRAFGNQDFEEKRFAKANDDLRKTNRFVNRSVSIMFPAVGLIMNLATVLIVWVGAHQIAQSQMQVGDLMAFIQYAMQIIFSFMMIAAIFILIPRASVSANRVADVLETEPTIEDPKKAEPFVEDKTGWVEFDHVNFAYPGADGNVLEDISFVAKPGQTTAIIGSTGAGKSTLLNLIPRLYDATSGTVQVSGQDVRDVDQHDLREEIGFVSQKIMLLSGTVESNIKYGRPDATQDEVVEAARVAQAYDFIERMDDGFQSPITEGATNVSGGQKQRIAIARALVKDAPIYVFDDSFSALDFKTDAELRGALQTYARNSTLMIVAQRVSTIMNAEQIIVLDEGKIVGKGTHQELLKNCPTYYEIASSQLKEDELNG